MRLSQVLGSQISNQSRSRGHSYFLSGAVRSLTVENGIIQATVRGSESYTVWIEPDGSLLRAACTCPYFIDRFEICKHIWAVILAAETQSVPLTAPGVAPESVDLEPLYPDEPDDDDEALEPWRPIAPLRPTSRTPAAPPAWRQLLDGITAAASGPVALRPRLVSGQLLYAVDAGASAKSDTLVVELMTRDRKINGEWGKPRPARVTGADIRAQADVRERHILERLLGARAYFDYGGYDTFGQELARLQIRGVLVSDIVPLLCATGRCVLRATAAPGPSSAPALSAPIEWDDGLPWSFTAAIRRADAGADYIVEGWFARGDERMELTDPVLVLADGILFTHSHAARLKAEAFAWLTALRRTGRIPVPLSSRDELIDALLASSPRLAFVPDDLQVETVQGQPRPQLRLRPMTYRSDRMRAELEFDYEGAVVAFESPQRTIRSQGSTRAIQRDMETERQALDVLHQRGCRHDWSQETGDRVLQIQSHLLPRLVRQLLDEGWHVEASGRVYRRPGTVSLTVSSGIDWFELHGHADYDGHGASLPVLLAALDRGEAFVTLDDGTMGLLPEEWLRRHATIARLGSASGDHLRFKTSQVALLDALIAAQPEASWDDAFAHARAQLQTFDGIQPIDPPAAFVGTLRGYQREGLGWLDIF